MSKSHRLAWAAGFIDGDGFITIQNRNTKHKEVVYTGTYLRIGACQASTISLEEMQNLFGGNIRPKNSGPNRDGYNRKPHYIWCLSTQQAADCIQQLLPYLVHKRDVALLALKFQETMAANKRQLPEETVSLRKQIQSDIAHLNSLS